MLNEYFSDFTRANSEQYSSDITITNWKGRRDNYIQRKLASDKIIYQYIKNTI